MVTGLPSRETVRRDLRQAGRIAGFVAMTGAMLPAFLLHERLVRGREKDRARERWVGAWSTALALISSWL